MISETGDVNLEDSYLKWSSSPTTDLPTCNFHKQIFSHESSCRTMSKHVTTHTDLSDTDDKTMRIARMGCTKGIEVKATVHWGDPKGPTITGSASGKIKDDRGNKAEVEVKVNGDGSGSATVSASHND